MFFEKEYAPSEIMGIEITDEELQQFLDENNIMFEIADNSTRWCAFAQYYAREHGLNDVSSASFAYMISMFMSGMGISASTEMYIKEETIETELLNYLSSLRDKFPDNEQKQMEDLFVEAFKIYSEDITNYEFKTERLNLRLGYSVYERFMSVEGETKADKLRKLINKYYEQ